MMTQKARSLGMSRTVYRNASGLPDPEQVTTARDLTRFSPARSRTASRAIIAYFQTRAFRLRRREPSAITTSCLGDVEGVDGIKTGYTRASRLQPDDLRRSAMTGRSWPSCSAGDQARAETQTVCLSDRALDPPRRLRWAAAGPATDVRRRRAEADPCRRRSHDAESTAATVPTGRPNRPLDLESHAGGGRFGGGR